MPQSLSFQTLKVAVESPREDGEERLPAGDHRTVQPCEGGKPLFGPAIAGQARGERPRLRPGRGAEAEAPGCTLARPQREEREGRSRQL